MNLTQKNNILFQLGIILNHLGKKKSWEGYELGISKSEYENLDGLIKSVHIYNGWFKEEEVRNALLSIGSWLTKENLIHWESHYKIQDDSGKKVAIIMAGNIPLVGFHDFISVFLCGHRSIIKMSSEDRHLFPALIKTMSLFDEGIWDWVELTEAPIQGFDAVIATGSNNSSRYFESYFEKYPTIIRKNRTSIAILDGSESTDQLKALGKDIFTYYGLGCRNVSQIWIPEDFVLDQFFKAIYGYRDIIHHNKYANNYDFNRAVLLLNEENILDNGFLLLKEDPDLHSPLAVLHYSPYKSLDQVERFIAERKEDIQLVIGKEFSPFGSSQRPRLNDYADGVDTMTFLTSL